MTRIKNTICQKTTIALNKKTSQNIKMNTNETKNKKNPKTKNDTNKTSTQTLSPSL